jgi:iron complex outermembrane receptor protein
MRRRLASCASFVALGWGCGLIAAGPARAAEPPAAAVQGDTDTLVGELVVTARKREERLRDIPVAATALGDQQLRDLGGVPTLQSLLSNVPGVNFSNTSNQVTSEVSIRGSGTSRATAAESGVGLYRDGAYLGGGYQGGRTFSKADFFDAQSIEVLRGVQGALNGRNAVGGSINIVSARPAQGERSGYATAKTATNQNREGILVVNQPLSDTLALRVGIDEMKQDKGFFYAPITGSYFDAQTTDLLRVQLGYKNGPVTANLLAEHGADQLPGIMYSVFILPGTNATYPKGVFDDKYNMHWNSPSTAKMRTNYYEFVGGYDLGFATATLTSSLRERHSQNAFDADGASPQFEAQALAQGLVAPGRAQADPNAGGLALDYSSILYNDLHVVGTQVGRLSWLAGVEYYDLNDTVKNILSRTPTPANPSRGTEAIALINFRSLAAYGSLGYDITDALNLTAEGRYTHDDKDIDSNRVDYGTGAPSGVGFAFTNGRTSSNFSYNVTLGYRLGDWLTYAKVGTAYRAGGFNLGLGDPRAPIPVPPTFGDEDTRGFEIGAKGNITPNIFVTAAAYRNDISNVLVQTQNGCNVGNPACPVAATNFIYNAGDARSSGVELEINGRAGFLGGVGRVTLGGSRQWGKVTSGPDAGKSQPQRPDWTSTFNLNYRHPLAGDADGFINLKGSTRGGGVQEIAQTPPLHDYQIYDLRVGATKGPWEAAFWMNNFANDSYIVFESVSVRRFNIPRTYGLDVTYRW